MGKALFGIMYNLSIKSFWNPILAKVNKHIHLWGCPEFGEKATKIKYTSNGILMPYNQSLHFCQHLKNLQESIHWLVQHGRVEGRALTPSCDNTGITTKCWTIIDRKTLELTKNDTPHPKTKEKPQWDGRRPAITIKSNPITAGWVTHKLENNYTTEVHPLEWRF